GLGGGGGVGGGGGSWGAAGNKVEGTAGKSRGVTASGRSATASARAAATMLVPRSAGGDWPVSASGDSGGPCSTLMASCSGAAVAGGCVAEAPEDATDWVVIAGPPVSSEPEVAARIWRNTSSAAFRSGTLPLAGAVPS